MLDAGLNGNFDFGDDRQQTVDDGVEFLKVFSFWLFGQALYGVVEGRLSLIVEKFRMFEVLRDDRDIFATKTHFVVGGCISFIVEELACIVDPPPNGAECQIGLSAGLFDDADVLSLLAVAQERHHKHNEDDATGDTHHDLLDEQRCQLTHRGGYLLVRIWHTQVPLMQYGRGLSPLQINAEDSGHAKDVFVATSRQIDQNDLIG
jgi:hypothetical protein